VKVLSYTDFSSRVHAASSNKRIPLDIGLDLTYRCNNRCVHCYCSLPENDKTVSNNELTTGEVKRLLDELASMGSLWLLITGGEPLLREDFEEIYLHAKKKGFLITLFTNGTLVDEKITELLSKYPPFAVEISLYGATREIYEKVTRVKGSYQKCLGGVRKIIKAGIKLKLKTMALTINCHELRDMDRMAREWGCEFRFDPTIQKRIDKNMFSEPERYRISPALVVMLDRTFPKRMEEWREFCEKFMQKDGSKDNKDADGLYQCGAGIGSMHVNPYGLAGGCLMTVMDGHSVREHELGWIWDKGIFNTIRQKKDFHLTCDGCHLASLCGQCAPWRIVENGDIKKKVVYLCEIAKIRSKDFQFINRSS
jgi:radical SAM protein with 4Fe4S-binding SPASM domain